MLFGFKCIYFKCGMVWIDFRLFQLIEIIDYQIAMALYGIWKDQEVNGFPYSFRFSS